MRKYACIRIHGWSEVFHLVDLFHARPRKRRRTVYTHVEATVCVGADRPGPVGGMPGCTV